MRKSSWLTICTLLCLAACGGEDTAPGPKKKKDTEPETEAKVTSVALDPTALLLRIGETKELKALVEGEGDFDPTVVWVSSAPDVAKVEDGRVTALAVGEASITATSAADPSKSATASVEVEEDTTQPVPPFVLTAEDVTLPVFGEAKLSLFLERSEDFTQKVAVRVVDLPAGISAPEVVEIAAGETEGSLTLTSVGAVKALEFELGLEAEAEGGAQANAKATLRVALVVTNEEDRGPGSLRSLLEIVDGLEPSAGQATITFRERAEGYRILLESTLEIGGKVRMLAPEPLDDGMQVLLEGNDSFRILDIAEGAEVEIANVHVFDGKADRGGGIRNSGKLELRRVALTTNEAEQGGGIYNVGELHAEDLWVGLNRADFGGGILNAGSLHLVRCRIVENQATQDQDAYSGGLENKGNATLADCTVALNRAQVGAGISNLEGTLLVRRSTLVHNSASEDGGAIYAIGGSTTVVNSTIARNDAELGAGLFVASEIETSVRILSSTITENEVTTDGAGIHNGGDLEIRNTIVAGNTLPAGGVDALTSRAVVCEGTNLLGQLDGDWVPGPNDGIAIAPEIGAGVWDDDAWTLHYVPQPASHAFDGVAVADCVDETGAPLADDQFGSPRPAGAACEIGAIEVQP